MVCQSQNWGKFIFYKTYNSRVYYTLDPVWIQKFRLSSQPQYVVEKKKKNTMKKLVSDVLATILMLSFVVGCFYLGVVAQKEVLGMYNLEQRTNNIEQRLDNIMSELHDIKANTKDE